MGCGVCLSCGTCRLSRRLSVRLPVCSGGVSQKIVLTDDAVKAQLESGALWKKLHRFLGYNYLVGASYSDKNAGVRGCMHV